MSNYKQLTKEDFKEVLEKEYNAFVPGGESFNELKFEYFKDDVFFYRAIYKADGNSYSMVLGIRLPKTGRGKTSDRLGATITINHVLKWLSVEDKGTDILFDSPKEYTLYLDLYDNEPDGTDNDNVPYHYKSITTCLSVGENVSV